LVHPSRFQSRSADELFGPLIEASAPDDPWANYLVQRYGSLLRPADL
jgi:hypothetical protein